MRLKAEKQLFVPNKTDFICYYMQFSAFCSLFMTGTSSSGKFVGRGLFSINLFSLSYHDHPPNQRLPDWLCKICRYLSHRRWYQCPQIPTSVLLQNMYLKPVLASLWWKSKSAIDSLSYTGAGLDSRPWPMTLFASLSERGLLPDSGRLRGLLFLFSRATTLAIRACMVGLLLWEVTVL